MFGDSGGDAVDDDHGEDDYDIIIVIIVVIVIIVIIIIPIIIVMVLMMRRFKYVFVLLYRLCRGRFSVGMIFMIFDIAAIDPARTVPLMEEPQSSNRIKPLKNTKNSSVWETCLSRSRVITNFIPPGFLDIGIRDDTLKLHSTKGALF